MDSGTSLTLACHAENTRFPETPHKHWDFIGRGGGDRNLVHSTKSHGLTALQPPFQNNRYKRYSKRPTFGRSSE